MIVGCIASVVVVAVIGRNGEAASAAERNDIGSGGVCAEHQGRRANDHQMPQQHHTWNVLVGM